MLFGVLGLAGAALLIDRGILGGGASSAVASTAGVVGIVEQLASASGAAPGDTSASPQTSLAMLLSHLDAAQGGTLPTSDPMHLPAFGADAVPDIDAQPTTPQAEIRVTSVVVWRNGGAAKINGVLMKPGQIVNGIELIEVFDDRVRIRKDGRIREVQVRRDL